MDVSKYFYSCSLYKVSFKIVVFILTAFDRSEVTVIILQLSEAMIGVFKNFSDNIRNAPS